MTNQRFHGTGVAMVTPFDAKGMVDAERLTSLVEFLIAGGVEYLVVLGTTGETATLDPEEKKYIFSHVMQVNAGRLPLVAGIGGNDTRSVVGDLQGYDLKGYDAVLSVSPYYNKPSQEGLFRHYLAIASESPLPVMMYNVPGRTGMNVSAETTIRIARACPNIFATKEACGNMDQIMRILRDKPQGFDVISGDDALTLPMIALGATGVISVVANAYPRIFSNMVRNCLRGDFKSALPDHHRLLEVVDTLFAEGSPAGVKAYMQELGRCQDHVRLPVVPVSDHLRHRIIGLMAGL
ncbi:MAG: 4-hydroxy-tetrahydrodipicolinate synthase [Chitinophagaceae bacterium]|nr:4-hydroxy-tetrahydrodipicolinate synthase [Chitinophagaceae bacterium]